MVNFSQIDNFILKIEFLFRFHINEFQTEIEIHEKFIVLVDDLSICNLHMKNNKFINVHQIASLNIAIAQKNENFGNVPLV